MKMTDGRKRFYSTGIALGLFYLLFGSQIATMQDAETVSAPSVISAPAAGAQQSQTRVSLVVDDNPPPAGFSITNLGTLGGSQSEAQAINDHGQIVGWAFNSSQQRRAFFYTNNQMRDLGTFGGAESIAYDINNAGKVVGSVRLTLFGNDYQAFLYDESVMRNLNSLIPAGSGWNLNEAFGINNVGQIVGRGTFNNQPRAFLLAPVGSQNTPPTVQITSPTHESKYGRFKLNYNYRLGFRHGRRDCARRILR